MSRRYIFDGMSSALLAVVRPSSKAPTPVQAPMQNSPRQSITTVPFPRDLIDAPINPLIEAMHTLDTIKSIPVRQPGFIPRSPHAPVGAKTMGVVDQRLAQYYPIDGARMSYPTAPMQAPARLQSIPGYITKQTIITRSSPGYPTKALKAPRPRTGGGGCTE